MKAESPRMEAFAPVRREVVIRASAAHAFRVFTEKMDAWWPRDHKIGQAPLARAVLEGKPNGRWYEVGEDGVECNWGKVLVWEPPRRLVLAWQISGNWKFDPGLITEVEVTFTPQGAGATQVVLEHRNLERFGAAAAGIRAAFSSPNGWSGILARYAEVAKA